MGQAARTEIKLLTANPHVIAVSPTLEAKWRGMGCKVTLIPNGCEAEAFRGTDNAPNPVDVCLRSPIAGFVGTLNERVDLDLLDAVAATGSSLLLVGPRAKALENSGALQALLRRPNVQWVGSKKFDEMPSYLKVIDVGLTPYADTAFNRASAPLKTIEYLAAGRPVVATDLPAARWLSTPFVTVATTREEFRGAVQRLLLEPRHSSLVAERQSFAARHSWRARGLEFAALLERIPSQP
jgi:teichuronic acid biosynthesis glycosyltransferase TuaH